MHVPVGGVGSHIRRVPWPDTYRTAPGIPRRRLAQHHADAVRAAIDSLREAGGLLICDEVQPGFGRTGQWWGHEGSGVVPDIVTLGKPMGAGCPIAGVVARGALLDADRRQEMYFNTFGGNPVACAAGLAVLEVIEQEGLLANADVVGPRVLKGLRSMQRRHEAIGEVRGRGLFFAVDLVKDRVTRAPDAGLAGRVVNDMRRQGVLISQIGPGGNVLKMRPPLCVAAAHADQLLDALAASLQRVAR